MAGSDNKRMINDNKGTNYLSKNIPEFGDPQCFQNVNDRMDTFHPKTCKINLSALEIMQYAIKYKLADISILIGVTWGI